MHFFKKSIYYESKIHKSIQINLKKKIFNKINLLIKKSSSMKKDVKNFEKNFAKFVGSKFCVSLGNTTDALEIAVLSLNLKKGTEIIIPVNNGFRLQKLLKTMDIKLFIYDVNLADYSIYLKRFKEKNFKKTSAIIAVHLYGNPTDMNLIKKIIKGKTSKLLRTAYTSTR